MGLRCSLLGHDYGETTTEREREEQGNEVVIVERELKVCSRCGNENVVSENTEVRSVEPDAEAASGHGDEPSSGADVSVPDASSGEAAAGTAEMAVDDAPTAGEDDGVILDDDGAGEEPAEGRERGQWPDDAQQEAMTETADAGGSDPAPWPEHEGEDEGYDAEPSGGEEAEGDFEFGGGLTPQQSPAGDADDEDAEYVEAPSQSQSTGAAGPGAGAGTGSGGGGAASESGNVEDSGFTAAGPVNPPTGTTDDADTVLVCPECGFEKTAARASLRAGDICPECRRGYLAEQR